MMIRKKNEFQSDWKRPDLAHLWRKVRIWIIAEDNEEHPGKQSNEQHVFSKKIHTYLSVSEIVFKSPRRFWRGNYMVPYLKEPVTIL